MLRMTCSMMVTLEPRRRVNKIFKARLILEATKMI